MYMLVIIDSFLSVYLNWFILLAIIDYFSLKIELYQQIASSEFLIILSFLNLLDILKGSGGSSSSTANLVEPSSVLEGLNNYFSSLSLLETYSLVHMSSMVLIVLCLFSIVSIFYS